MSAGKLENTQYGFIFGPATITRIGDSEKWGCTVEVSSARQRVEIWVTPAGQIRVGPIITRTFLAELAVLRADNLTAHKMACAAGIERDTLRAELERLKQVGNAVVERWETPLWKDVEPTAHIIYALRDELAAQQKSTNETNTTQTSF